MISATATYMSHHSQAQMKMEVGWIPLQSLRCYITTWCSSICKNEIEGAATLFLAVNSVLWMMTAPSMQPWYYGNYKLYYIYIYVDICMHTLLEVWTGCVCMLMCSHYLWMHKQNASTQYCCKKVAAACPSRMAPLRAACDFLWREASPLCLTVLVLAWVLAR